SSAGGPADIGWPRRLEFGLGGHWDGTFSVAICAAERFVSSVQNSRGLADLYVTGSAIRVGRWGGSDDRPFREWSTSVDRDISSHASPAYCSHWPRRVLSVSRVTSLKRLLLRQNCSG